MHFSFSLKRVFLLGLVIRILIMPFTFHWDLYALHIVANQIFTNGILGFYTSFIADYPPLTYISLALWQILIKPFFSGDINMWLNAQSMDKFMMVGTFRNLFLLKLFYLPFDIGIAYLLSKFGRTVKESKILAVLWLFNPIVLYIVIAWGTIDVIPAFLTLWALYLAMKKKNYFSLILLGIGTMFKLWPVLLIPPFILLSYKDWTSRLKALIAAAIPLVVAIPYMFNASFWKFVFFSEQSASMGNSGFYLGLLQWLLLFPLLYILLLFFCHEYLTEKKERLIDVSLVVLMMFYILSAFTPQWFLWILPILIIQMVYHNLIKYVPILLMGYLLVILTFDASLSVGMLGPIEPSIYQVKILKEYVELLTKDPNKVFSLMRTINSAVLVWFLYRWWSVKKKTI